VKTLSRGSLAAAAVALGLVGAGCGGDDNKDTTQATVTQTTTAPPTQPKPAPAQTQPAQTQPATPIQPMEEPTQTSGDDQVTREDINTALHNELTSNQGFSEAQADCVIRYLTDKVTDAEFVENFQRLERGEVPDDFSDAGQACADA
jgi:hypothetical protein